jgi:UDP-2,3-diacylglucosamine pyrophosphatase LpxH
MYYKTVWLSDLHLGMRGCNAEGLLSFLRANEFDKLYLVGDVIDLWKLKKDHYWPQTHNDVIQKLLRKARKGTQIVLIPGNHDAFFGQFLGVYGNICIKPHDLYVSEARGRLLVMHGHEFDAVMQHAKWLAYLGDKGYAVLLAANGPLNCLRRHLGMEYWSLSAYAKSRVKNAVSFISQFEDAVVRYAAMHRADGIVCGHSHTPAVRQIRDIRYYNCGDWVESSTALVEHVGGRIELVRWDDAALADMLDNLEPHHVGAEVYSDR